ncbi:MAG: ferrous iron transporter B, partial [Coriobacteriia bacterium]|nr:ferrous iron transporter B [Coriobacteriia bacterium]
MSIQLALAGNPNCGKTTLFNRITGENGYVGNWPGVTVEKKQAKLLANKDVVVTDLPGIYSLSPYSPEEVVSRDYLVQDRPDVIVNLIDATNLERNLYLTTQLVELGLPMVVGLNMADLVRKNGDKIDPAGLSKDLGCPVVEVSALKGQGVDELLNKAVEIAKAKKVVAPQITLGETVEAALKEIVEIGGTAIPANLSRWYAVKLFEGDEKACAPLRLSADQKARIAAVKRGVEKAEDDDAESIVTMARYDLIADVIPHFVKKAPKKVSMTEKIDRVVTNRWLGLPIFAVVMVFVYWISVSTVGTIGTDWANDGLFGDGWHLFGIGTSDYEDAVEESGWGEDFQDWDSQISAYVAAGVDAGVDGAEAVQEQLDSDEGIDPESEDFQTFLAAAQADGLTATADLHDADGNTLDTEGNAIPEEQGADGTAQLQLAEGEQVATVDVDAAQFETAVNSPEPDPADYGVWVPGVPVLVSGGLDAISVPEDSWVRSLILDGIVAGVGAILGFVPQMIVLFILLCFLEDCGYLSRVAFVMDRVFRRFGLSGKSFIPMLISSGCGVPGVMSTKAIENEGERRMTIMTTTMIPCGAKLPIIALLMGALIGDNTTWWISPLFYFLGVIAIIVSGIMLKKTKPFAGEASPFVMEL